MPLTVRNNDNKTTNDNCMGRKKLTSKFQRQTCSFQTFGKSKKLPVSEETKKSEPDVEKRVQDLPILPEGVRNIDDTEEGVLNPQLCAEYSPFLYAYLRELEDKLCIRKDFLMGLHINGRIRSVLIDWLIDVHNQFKLLQETLYLAIFMLDRYLQLEGQTVKRNRYQLVGVTALFTASKIEEMYPPEIRDFVYITDNSFSSAEIRQMELRMLTTLKFGLGRPIPLHFLRRYSKAGEVDILQHTLAKYLMELCQIEYDFAHINPSLLSATALCLSLLLLTPDCEDEVWSPTLEYYSTFSKSQLMPLVTKMAAVAYAAPKNQLKAIFNKYSSKSRLRVSLLPELRGSKIKALISTKNESS